MPPFAIRRRFDILKHRDNGTVGFFESVVHICHIDDHADNDNNESIVDSGDEWLEPEQVIST